jgi:hypothetical protein
VFPRLIDECGGEEPGRIKLAHRKAVHPTLATARKAMNPGAVCVPVGDVDAVASPLAEEQHRHGWRQSKPLGEQKANWLIFPHEKRLVWCLPSFTL